MALRPRCGIGTSKVFEAAPVVAGWAFGIQRADLTPGGNMTGAGASADELAARRARTAELALVQPAGQAHLERAPRQAAGYRGPSTDPARHACLRLLHRAVLDRIGHRSPPTPWVPGRRRVGSRHRARGLKTADGTVDDTVTGDVLVGPTACTRPSACSLPDEGPAMWTATRMAGRGPGDPFLQRPHDGGDGHWGPSRRCLPDRRGEGWTGSNERRCSRRRAGGRQSR